MTRAVFIDGPGGAEKLEIRETKIEKPGRHELIISQKAFGINYIDIMQRQGKLPVDSFPAILGVEGVGVVEELGADLGKIEVGDRVAYATALGGGYSTRRKIHGQYVVQVPEYITDVQAAAFLTKGLLAHGLLRRCYFVKADEWILVYSAAGGLGSLLCQWGRNIKARVIGVVGSDEKMEYAKANGAEFVCNYRTTDLKKFVNEVTGGRGVQVVYDPIGQETFDTSISCLNKFGIMVMCGEISGRVKSINTEEIYKKNIFITGVNLFEYKSYRLELVLSCNEVFENIKDKVFDDSIINAYHMEQIVDVHRYIESRASLGPSVIVTE